MKKILITGGAGYIGSVLTEYLLKLNYEVTVIDNFLYSQSSLNHLFKFKNLKIFNLDVRDKKSILPMLKEFDIIIPLAALVGAPICKKDPVGSSSINKDAVTFIFDNVSPSQIILMPTTICLLEQS